MKIFSSKIFTLLLAIIAVFLIVGFYGQWQAKKELQEKFDFLKKRENELQAENSSLEKQIGDLKSDPESAARKFQVLKKEGESALVMSESLLNASSSEIINQNKPNFWKKFFDFFKF